MIHPTIKQLTCLNSWPKGTVGYVRENKTIEQLLQLCEEHGFGRIPQLANAIEEIWRDPNAVTKWQKFREQQLSVFEDYKNYETT